MNKLNIFLFISLFFIWGCKDSTYRTSGNAKMISVKLEKNDLRLSSFAEKVEIVPIETIEKAIFDRKGKFINKIDKVGRGPEEYIDCFDFYVRDNEKEICILDRASKRLITYDYQGNYKNTIKLPFYTWQIVSVGDKSCTIFLGNDDSGSDFKFLKLNNSDSRVTNKFHPIIKNMGGIVTLCKDYFFRNNNYFLFYEPYNDTIYTLNSGITEPKYIIDYNGENIPPSFFSKKYRDVMEFSKAYKKTSYVNGTYNVMETGKRVLFTSYKKKVKYLTLYDKYKQKSESYNSIIDDYFFENIPLGFNRHQFHFWVIDEKKILFVIPAPLIVKNKKYLKKNVLNQLQNIEEEDNPVCYIIDVE